MFLIFWADFPISFLAAITHVWPVYRTVYRTHTLHMGSSKRGTREAPQAGSHLVYEDQRQHPHCLAGPELFEQGPSRARRHTPSARWTGQLC